MAMVMGEQGVLVGGGGCSERVPPISVEVLGGLGAGDAFGGAVCHGILEGWDPVGTVGSANAAAVPVAARLERAHPLPTAGRVQELLDATR
jgi:5-dehydro-2-deoxygluconokinase